MSGADLAYNAMLAQAGLDQTVRNLDAARLAQIIEILQSQDAAGGSSGGGGGGGDSAVADATTDTKGVVKLATDLQAIAGADSSLVVTPHALLAALSSISGPLLVWREVSGAYADLPVSPPAGIKLILALGLNSPMFLGKTIPAWVDGINVNFIYLLTPL